MMFVLQVKKVWDRELNKSLQDTHQANCRISFITQVSLLIVLYFTYFHLIPYSLKAIATTKK